ncbi:MULTISPECIES: acetolactate synthase small subunit [Aquirufa]|uniref:Acetolactate synthase small subunit n=2 Tax=Aquirufa TaxID=2676247 RepID=A0A2S2DX30_9BACT|nr:MULTISPECIES: acetolactate synthase small subunit [Aquirufa]AWL09916.1 Acetolactate synthase [Aquirufa nivalisilvae]MBZ1326416.1 acetolactate synthase small subunit [Aquirufa aurantiipilula]MCZ2480538.1 acetolactate synthase small subunit [Aquirufa nivalisilvae]MCZ2482773.1 acetolactate synthase small subunit [Aquirufa nivalisilvae]MDF5689428.1 acetolactate synthase small subunit [Aquirufa aurantiipilula]
MLTTYTISVFTTNTIGLLNRITIIFTRRRLNIECLTVSETERKGVSRFTIVIRNENREIVEKLVRQIRKITDVLAVFGYLDDEIVFNEIALFKIATPLGSPALDVKTINLDWNAKVVHWGLDYVVVEKNGSEEEINEFYAYLKQWEILEYIKSGRVAVGKTEKGLVEYLPEGNWEIV